MRGAQNVDLGGGEFLRRATTLYNWVDLNPLRLVEGKSRLTGRKRGIRADPERCSASRGAASGGQRAAGVHSIMPVRMRLTVKAKKDRASELRTAADVRRDLWAHSPVEVDPDHPLHGTHRDQDGRVYFEFATELPDEVRRVIEKYQYTDNVELTETSTLPGEECANCGNVAGPLQPTVCPNCQFRDISPCPICRQEVSRQSYTRISGDRFRCPNCKNRVRLRFNSPMFLPDGSYNQPLVVVEEATALHEV
jgi:hypothetical protein